MADNFILRLRNGFLRKADPLFLMLFLLLAASFLLSTASHRLVFYLLTPGFFYCFYRYRDLLMRICKTRGFTALCLYLGYFTLSAFWGPTVTAIKFLDFFKEVLCVAVFVPALALAAVINRGRFNAEELFRLSLIVPSYILISALVFIGDDSFADDRFIGIGRYKNPIHFSLMLGIYALFLICLGRLETRKLELTRQTALGLTLIASGLTKSRTVFIALPAAILSFAGLGRAKLALKIAGGMAVAFAICLLVWDFNSHDLIAKADNDRFGIWSDAYRKFTERPVFGHGVLDETKFGEHRKIRSWEATHNIILGHLFTGGVCGLLILIFAYANMLWSGIRSYYKSKNFLPLFVVTTGVFGFIAGQFVFMHFAINMHIQWLIFWVPFALAWALEYDLKNRTA